MRAAILLFASQCLGLGSDITGTWALNRETRAAIAPFAVQIEQSQAHLLAVRVMRQGADQYLEQIPLDGVEIRLTAEGREIRLPGETWILTVNGNLIIHVRGARFVLVPAREFVE